MAQELGDAAVDTMTDEGDVLIMVEVERVDIVGRPSGENTMYECEGYVNDSIHTGHRIKFLADVKWVSDFRFKSLPGQVNNYVAIAKWRIV